VGSSTAVGGGCGRRSLTPALTPTGISQGQRRWCAGQGPCRSRRRLRGRGPGSRGCMCSWSS